MILPQRSTQDPSASYTILVIDRHPAIGDAIAAKLKHLPHLVYSGQAMNASEGFDSIEKKQPNIVISSLSLEDAYGLDLASQILSMYSNTRIIIYSQYEEHIFAERAIEVGIMGYVMKRSPLQELINGIQSVIRNETYLSAPMTVRLLNKITKGFSDATTHALDKLSHRELSVLLMLSEGSNPNEIASRLKLDRKTVETHRRRVKEKLQFESISQLIRFATQWRQTQGRLLPDEFFQESNHEQALHFAT